MRLHVQTLDNMIGIMLFYVSHGRGFSSLFSTHYKKRALEIIGNPSGFKVFTIFRSVLFCGILWHFEG